jgi:hypothetical protein
MSNLMKLSVVVLISQYLLCSFGIALAEDALVPTTVKVSLEKAVITQHEPTIIDVVIVSSSSSSTGVHFDPGYDNERIDVRVVDPGGQILLKPHIVRQGMRFSNSIHIEAGRTAVVSVVLNDWFSFDQVGNYVIEVTLLSTKESAGEGVGHIDRRLALAVLPRNEAALDSECSSLLTRIKDSQSYVEQLVAAKGLSSVNDPNAVPFLLEAMKRKEFASLMIAALARIKTGDAVGALAVAEKSDDPDTSALARSALLSLRQADKP